MNNTTSSLGLDKRCKFPTELGTESFSKSIGKFDSATAELNTSYKENLNECFNANSVYKKMVRFGV